MGMRMQENVNGLEDIILLAKEEAMRIGNKKIYPEHLFLALLKSGDDRVAEIIKSFGVDVDYVKERIEQELVEKKESYSGEDLEVTLSAGSILRRVSEEAWSLGDSKLEEGHLMLAILRNKAGRVTKLFNSLGINYELFRKELVEELPVSSRDLDDEDDEEGAAFPRAASYKGSNLKSATPVLDEYGTDITRAALEGRLDPVFGREKEIERIVQILSRRKKNNPVLIGESGVGKSAIVEGLALRIVNRNVSRVLFDKRVVALNMGSLVAGTKYRGQFEERMRALLKEIASNKDIILFVDEVHTIVGAGSSSGSLDAANMLKPALARGEIQCIGATTLDEYRKSIETDGALERRFQKVLVEPNTAEEAVDVLKSIREKYEDYHNVRYSDEAIKAAVRLTERYVSDRSLPDKAIDALDEAGSRAHISHISVPPVIEELEERIEELKVKKKEAVKLQKFELAAAYRDEERKFLMELAEEKENWKKKLNENRVDVSEEDVAEVVAMMTGVPVNRIAKNETEKLLRMGEDISRRIVGQDEAIRKIVKAIHRNRAGLKDPNRPIGSFVFLGPTGVGKTQLAKVLAEYLFDTTEALIRIDMSEYMEKYAVSRLIGSPPGYVGYEEGGQLTEKVRRKPYAVILLDEIEKAHPDIFNILLQLLDDGRLTDGLGRQIDFKNTIIIMTSNIGSREISDFGRGIGFGGENRSGDKKFTDAVVQKALKRTFSPEFLNRVDQIIVFNALNKDDIYKIVDIELGRLFERLEELGFTVDISGDAKKFLVEKGYDPQYGARPLKRAIGKYLEDLLAEYLIRDNIPDKKIEIGYCRTEDGLVIR